MKITAIRPEDLPFFGEGKDVCLAARAGSAKMMLPGIAGEFDVQFIGTGAATIQGPTQNVFDPNDERISVDMEWYQNKFVGHHWLLGDFKITLAEDMISTGTIEATGDSDVGANIINTNDFFFDFEFKRFPFLNMANVTPIRNTGVITSMPPTGSVFKLEQPANELFEFKRGADRITNREGATATIIKFNQCDVVVFPEQNVGLQLIEQKRQDDGSYSVTVEIENITDTEATFAHFSVIHYAGVTIDNDYGFVLLKPGAKKRIAYKVVSTINDRVIDLPFFAALYQPTELNGSKSLELLFTF